MSKRTERLNKRAAELRTLEHVAQIRVSNATRGLTEAGGAVITFAQTAIRMELEAARKALREIHEEQQSIIQELDRHVVDFPDMAMIMVEIPDGYQIFEHRDPNGTETDETGWYSLNAAYDATPSTFDMITSDLTENANGDEEICPFNFYRIYTQDEVDDLLDRALNL